MFDNFPPHNLPDMTFANPAPDPALHQAQNLAMRQAAGAEQQAARAGQCNQPHPQPPEPAKAAGRDDAFWDDGAIGVGPVIREMKPIFFTAPLSSPAA